MAEKPYRELSANQIRVQVDTAQTFEAYRDVRAARRRFAGGMTWRTVGGREYLIKILDRNGRTKSLGPRSSETELIYEQFVTGKAAAIARLKEMQSSLAEFAGMSRGVGINRVPRIVCDVLRKLDEQGFLEKNLMVIGTNAMYAYEAAGGVVFESGLMGTTDVDFLWDARSSMNLAWADEEVSEFGVLAVLKKVDRSFEKVGQNGFRAVNGQGFFVDLVKQAPNPPWKAEKDSIAPSDLRPAWIGEMKWLLASMKFRATVTGQDGMPAPMVAPDPRAFAIHKCWLSQQDDRDPRKKRRDMLQAQATLQLVRDKFPHLKMGADIERLFPKAVLDVVAAPLGLDRGADIEDEENQQDIDLGR